MQLGHPTGITIGIGRTTPDRLRLHRQLSACLGRTAMVRITTRPVVRKLAGMKLGVSTRTTRMLTAACVSCSIANPSTAGHSLRVSIAKVIGTKTGRTSST